MFITAALRDTVEEILRFIEGNADRLVDVSRQPEWWREPIQRLAAERALHLAVESTVDAANTLIDALVMRDPGSYADILKVLVEEGVLADSWFTDFEPVVSFRDKLVRSYRTIDEHSLRSTVEAAIPLFPPFVQAIRRYLDIPAARS